MRNLQEYFRPASAEEAVEIKSEYGAAAAYLAGGSDLLVHRPDDLRAVIDIRHAGLGYVRDDEGAFVFGGAALLRDVEEPAAEIAGGMLRDAFRNTAPWLIRNSATPAGNIANASPAADSPPALIALDAELVVLWPNANGTGAGSGPREERVAVEDVFEAPHRTTLGDGLIREIRISRNAASRKAVFTKLARSASDIALVNLAVALDEHTGVVRNVRIALGAVAPTPIRARRSEALLEGQSATPELLREVERQVREEVRPISDWRASEEYRRRMSGVLVRRALVSLSREL
jgi:aerobic carbon-monoxide dehydrogenase medium subunit